MLSASYDGHDIEFKPSFEYISYRWRKEMKVSWQAWRDTPLDVMLRDLEYIGLERQIRAAKEKSQYADTRK